MIDSIFKLLFILTRHNRKGELYHVYTGNYG